MTRHRFSPLVWRRAAGLAAPAAALAAVAALAAPASAQRVMMSLQGRNSGDQFGWSLAPLGDLNGDGHDDFAVGAPRADYNGSDSGSVYLFSGRTMTEIIRFDGPDPGDFYGTSVSSAGDVNSDGFEDILIGAPGNDQNGLDAGLVHVMSGAEGGTAGLLIVRVGFPGQFFGFSVSGGADLDNDGRDDDFAAGAPGDPEDTTAMGRVMTFLGDPVPSQVRAQRTLVGPVAGDRFGHAVAVHGDLDGDGFDDLLVGAPRWEAGAGNIDNGFARVYTSREGRPLYTIFGQARGANLGWSVAAAPSVSGGPAPESLAGARFEYDRGRVHVVDGNTGSIARIYWGFVRSVWFGAAIAYAGDVNRDGVGDFIFGSPLHGMIGGQGYVEPIRGQARVLSGSTGDVLFSMDGFGHMDWFGHSVAGGRDFNNDGFDDLLVGAPISARSTGAVHVFAGSKPSLYAQELMVSIRNGGTQDLYLDAGPANANAVYVMLGTLTGTRPGLPLGSMTIPLNPDPYFWFTLNNPNRGLLQLQVGTLNAAGRGTAAFTLPQGLPRALLGQTFQHAYVLLDGAQISFASNPLPVFVDE